MMACCCCTIYLTVFILMIFLILFVIVPLIFMFTIDIQRAFIFPTNILEPKNFSDPESYGIFGVKNMYITVPYKESDNITLGMWQILPKEQLNDLVSNDEYNYDGILAKGKHNVLLYLHGNGSDRTNSIRLYEILREFFHIFAVDYRGYGDSTPGELSEHTIVSDLEYVFKWLKKKSNSRIFIWGHSLGTGVGTLLSSDLFKKNISVSGLMLEAPFTSVTDIIRENVFVKFYTFLPWFEATIIDPIVENGMDFNSKLSISGVNCPIMMLHAEDDEIIPFKFATELYYTAVNNRNFTYQGNVTYHLYGEHGYGHMLIFLAPELPDQIQMFKDECVQFETQQTRK